MKTILKNATLINEGKMSVQDVLIAEDRIEKIASNITHDNANLIDLKEDYLVPGVIDDQVHFREPGLTHKATISTESKAALAGGITSYLEMPNTNPQTTTAEKFQDKLDIAEQTSWANYGFMFGGTNDNYDEIMRFDPQKMAGLKLFLGSSTGNMLVDSPEVLEKIFANFAYVISTHCEDETTIRANTEKAIAQFGENIPIGEHYKIRSDQACYISSQKAIEIAKKHHTRLHVFHLSTAKEMSLFETGNIQTKNITAEVCVHHLFFDERDYETKGSRIKWNPAVKTQADKSALREALAMDKLDVIATDHAPHTWEEKQAKYLQCPSGAPLVQHSLLIMFELANEGVISLPKVIEKMCHNPAKLFDIKERGFIREGYFADLVQVSKDQKLWIVAPENLYYKCGWSPLEGHPFKRKIERTWLNGHLAYDQGVFSSDKNAKALTYAR